MNNNMKSGLMLAVNPNFEREKNDFYATDPNALKIALPLLREIGLDTNLWECSCGEGHLSKVLLENGYNVKSTDLIYRGFGVGNEDFLKHEEKWDGDIITNPPFKYAEDFIKKSMELLNEGHKAIFFLKIQFLESRRRKNLFKEFPPKFVIVNSERQKCAKNGEFHKYCKNANTQCWCWYVFEKGFKGNPQIMWI